MAAGGERLLKALRLGPPLAAAALALVPAVACATSADPDAQASIVGGRATSVAAYPWQAALVLDERFGKDDFEGQFCGGSLIAPRIVLTASHCVADTDPDCVFCTPASDRTGDGSPLLDPDDVDIVLGRTTLTSSSGREHDAQAIYPHPAYSPVTVENDVALIVLATRSSQAPIKLAGPGERPLWTARRDAYVSGWGQTHGDDDLSNQNTLRHARVPIVADGVCGSPDVYDGEFVRSLMVCAGSLAGGVDACYGDSGGPLASPAAGGVFRQTGVVSFGSGCAARMSPGVYSRVADVTLRSWIVAAVDQAEQEQSLADQGEVVGAGAVVPRCGGAVSTRVGSNDVDALFGGRGRDSIVGNAGDDLLRGLDGRDRICANGGRDRVRGGAGPDRLVGGPGPDRLVGGPGPDTLVGGPGPDMLVGGGGRDRLFGGGGRDRLIGGGGDDRLVGGRGRDRCRGGPGADRKRTC